MEAVNIFSAENLEGRIDVASALGSTATVMFIYDLAPGQSSSPYHYEYEEEWLLVIDGTIVLRAPAAEHTLERGDLVCFPPGPAGAHKLMNRSDSPARTLMFSSSRAPAVSVYPDSDKVGVHLDEDTRADLQTRHGGALVGRGGRLGESDLTNALRLTKAQARRIAVRAQLLDAPRPTDLLAVVRQLTLLQIDPTAAIAPSADLVAWSRLGSAYRPEDLRKALEQDRTLFEHNALVRPMSDVGLHPRPQSDEPQPRANGSVDPRQRPLPARHRQAAPQVRAAELARHPRHVRRPVGLDGLDERPQRDADAGVPDDARRGRDRRA